MCYSIIWESCCCFVKCFLPLSYNIRALLSLRIRVKKLNEPFQMCHVLFDHEIYVVGGIGVGILVRKKLADNSQEENNGHSTDARHLFALLFYYDYLLTGILSYYCHF
mmetsp:Transcript_25393/g.41874  ORF Transcript_25393/g.41874 Transcript_25393/m.41874 type:complete len:108 (-) Transcript_25393:82-405(-)